MLEHFYESSSSLLRLDHGPFVKQMNGLADRLYQTGYRRKYGQRILWTVGKFNEFARAAGIEGAEEINQQLIRRFLDEEVIRERVLASAALGHYWKHLRDQGIVPVVVLNPSDPCESTLRKYDEHLYGVRGLAPSSRTESLRYARRFLTWLRNRHGDDFLDRLNGVDVLEFITDFAGRHPSCSWRNSLCSYTRVFLRYLRWEGNNIS